MPRRFAGPRVGHNVSMRSISSFRRDPDLEPSLVTTPPSHGRTCRLTVACRQRCRPRLAFCSWHEQPGLVQVREGAFFVTRSALLDRSSWRAPAAPLGRGPDEILSDDLIRLDASRQVNWWSGTWVSTQFTMPWLSWQSDNSVSRYAYRRPNGQVLRVGGLGSLRVAT